MTERAGVGSRVAAWLGLGRRDAVTETRAVLWPPVITEPRYLSRRVIDGGSAAAIPAVGRALGLYTMIGMLDMGAWRGPQRLPVPSLLQRPDPNQPGATWFVQQHVSDWLLSGNAVHLVTVRDAAGFPAACSWFPAHLWTVTQGPLGEDRSYWLAGRRVPIGDVVHVKRGHDPQAWGARGIGIVQQHLRTLQRVAMQEDAESGALEGGGVPSVAIIAPQADLTKREISDAGADWIDQFGGPQRLPAILPAGTQVVPLGWSASDSEMVEARRLSLQDVANLCGLDGYWLGAPSSSHTYKSPGPLFVALLRTALEPVLSLFEDAWSDAWLPRGQRVRFDRDELTRDDLASQIAAMRAATGRATWTLAEAREYMGRDPGVVPDAVVVPVQGAPAEDEEQAA